MAPECSPEFLALEALLFSRMEPFEQYKGHEVDLINEKHSCAIILNQDQWIRCCITSSILSYEGHFVKWSKTSLGNYGRRPYEEHLSCDARFPSMWYVRPAKAQVSLHICAV